MIFSLSGLTSIIAAADTVCDPTSSFFGFMGVTAAIVFANLGAAYINIIEFKTVIENGFESFFAQSNGHDWKQCCSFISKFVLIL